MEQRRQIHQIIGLMQKNLECVICLEVMKKPVSTECGHQFCGFCLREFLKTKKSVPCPLCKKPVTKRSLVDRPYLSEIVDNVRSLVNAVELDIGHFSPERGLELNFIPSTPEELPTSRHTRGSKRKEKEEFATASDDARPKRRRSDTTGLCQTYLTKQPTRRSDTTGQGQQRSNNTGQGQQRSNITNKGKGRSTTTNQIDKNMNLDNKKQAKEVKSVNQQHLLEEIQTADMKCVTPETDSILTGDTRGGCGMKSKNLSQLEQSPSRVTRSRQKSADSRRESTTGQAKNTPQDHPSNDNLLQYLAHGSCGAMEKGQYDEPEVEPSSHNSLSPNVEVRYGSSDDNSDVEMMYSNVTEENHVCDDENMDENEMPVGKDLISLGKEAKLMKDQILKERSVNCDLSDERNGIFGGVEEGDRTDVKSYDGLRQGKDINWNRKDTHTTTSGDKQNTDGLEFRPKKKLLFRKKQKPDVEEEEVTQLSGMSSSDSCHGIFDKGNTTRTYARKQDSKLEKDRQVKKWLKSTSENVDKFGDTNNTPDVQSHIYCVLLASSELNKNGSAESENLKSSHGDYTVKPNVDQDKGLVPNNRKKIFKTKLDHPVGVTTTVQQVKGKFVVRKVSPVRVEQTLTENKSVKETKAGDMLGGSPESDPYEFKPSQRTPKANKKVKKETKKCRKNPINIQIGDNTKILREKVIDSTLQTNLCEDMLESRSSLRSRSKENVEDRLNQCNGRKRKPSKIKSDCNLQQGTEDVEKIINDLNQAEAFDLITCTQEASDRIIENRISVTEERTHDQEGCEEDDPEGCEEEKYTDRGIKSLDKIKDTQDETDIGIVNHNHSTSITDKEKQVLLDTDNEMDVENKKCDDSEFVTSSVSMIADTCTEKNLVVESLKGDHQNLTVNSIDMIADSATSLLRHGKAGNAEVADKELVGCHDSRSDILPPPAKEFQSQNDSHAHRKCGENQNGSQSQAEDGVGQSTEDDTECGSLVSDTSCVPNTDDSIVSRRTTKLRNSLRSRKSVSFSDKALHILGHDDSQGHKGREPSGCHLSGSDTRGHSQGQVTRGQRSSSAESRGHAKKSKESLTQALQENGSCSSGMRSPQRAESQRTKGKREQKDDCDQRRFSQGNVKDIDSCIADTLQDELDENISTDRSKSCSIIQVQVHSSTSQENIKEIVAVHSQTFDPEQEVYTEPQTSEDRIPDTEVEIVPSCGEHTQESVSTQPPSDELQFGARSRSKTSSSGKSLRGTKGRKSPDAQQDLPDKSPLVVMETQMSGNTSSRCETFETQESVSLLVGNDLGRIEQPEVELVGRENLTMDKPANKGFTEISSKHLAEELSVEDSGKVDEDSVKRVPQKNRLKRRSPGVKSQPTSSLVSLSSQCHGDSATQKKSSCHDNKPSSVVICTESEVIVCGEDSTTSLGSTVIPATAQASRDTTQIIQICEVEDKSPRKGNRQNDGENMSAELLVSGNVNEKSSGANSVKFSKRQRKLRSGSRSLEEISSSKSLEEISGSRSLEENSGSRSLVESGSKEEVMQQSCKETLSKESQSVCNQSQQRGQGQHRVQGQDSFKGHKATEKDKSSENCVNQKVVKNESEERATNPINEELMKDQSVDVDDLTPTLKPVDKGHKRKRVTRQNCSPEDIFMMDSKKMAAEQASSVVQNQEGVMNLTSLELIDPSQPPSLELDASQPQSLELGPSQPQSLELDSSQPLSTALDPSQPHSSGLDLSQPPSPGIKDMELKDCDDGEHSAMETSQSIAISDKGTNEGKQVQYKKLAIEGQNADMIDKDKTDENEFGSMKEQDNIDITDADEVSRSKKERKDKEIYKRYVDSDPDSDLSQNRQTKETGFRCKRGLATRKWQKESQNNSHTIINTHSSVRDSSKSPRQPSSDEENSRKNYEMLVTSDDLTKENPVKIQPILSKIRTDSDDKKMISLKEKFKKTFKKHASRSPALKQVVSPPTVVHSPPPNHHLQQREKDTLVSDEEDHVIPEFVDKVEQTSESVIMIPDSFPCSSVATKGDNFSSPTCKSPPGNLVRRSSNKNKSPVITTSKESKEDKFPLSDDVDNSDDATDGTSSFEGRRRPVIGRRRRRPVIEESEDEMYDASSPLPDVIMNSCQQGKTCTDDDPDQINVSPESVLCEEEDRTVEMDKEGTTVIAESDEDKNDEYSSSEESDSGRRLNLTSSSAFSSQSEAMTTQNRKALEKDLERMKREIAELEKQLANNPDQNSKSTPKSSSKKKTEERKVDKQRDVSEDSDSDLVLEVDRDGLNDGSESDLHDGSEGDLNNDMIDLVTSSPVIQTSQESRFRVGEDGMADWQEGEDLFLSPLPPSPPPTPSQPRRGPPSKLSENPVPLLSSPCDNTAPLRKELSSPQNDDGNRNRQSQQRGFVTTGLTYLQTRELQKLAQQNNDKFYVKFNPSTTHVIVKTVPLGGRVCERTLKFFQGMANQCWVLDYQWVADCKAAGYLLPEDKYEIVGDTITGNRHYGPRQSRISTEPLFDGFHFFCLGTSDSLTTEDLQDLIVRCGGTVVDHPSAFPPDTKLNIAVTCIDLEDEDDLPSPEDTRVFNKLHKRFGLLTVSREWVLDTLTVYTVQPLKDYVLTTVRHIQIPELVGSSKTT